VVSHSFALMISDVMELKFGGWNMPKDRVERCLNIDILDLQRGGLLNSAAGVPSEIQWATHGKVYSTVGYVLEKHDGIPTSMRLQYTASQRNCDYRVSIRSTPCNYGGVRLWFLCPGWKNGAPCGRQCRKLYLKGIVFACRICHELTYESTQKSGSRFYELIERPMKIRDRTAPGLRDLRAGGKRDRALRRMDWADRAIKLGFRRIPGAAEILGPLWQWEKNHFRR
jgi:hypothetical protein